MSMRQRRTRILSSAIAATFTTSAAIAMSAPAWSQQETAVNKPPKVEQELPPIDEELILLPPPEAIAPLDPVETEGEPSITISEETAGDEEIIFLDPLPPPEQPDPDGLSPSSLTDPEPDTLPPTPDPITIPVLEPLPQPPGYNPPSQQDTPIDEFKQYRLGIGDLLNIVVVGFPEFSTQGSMNLEGQMFIPILGARDFRGFTLREVEEQLSHELGTRYLQQVPEVIVSLSQPRPVTITVAGDVVEPGFYELASGSDPFDAVFRAGGSRPSADLREVLVRRTLLDGRVIEQTVDLLTPLQTGSPFPTMFLLNGDAVIVSRLALENASDYDSQLAARANISQASITVRVLNHAGRGLGAVELPNGSTFVDALTRIAPDTTEANLSSIALVRFDPEQGRPVTQKLNGRRALLGDSSEDIPLEDQDVIIVGRSLIAKVSNALNLFTRPFRDVLGFLLFFREIGDSADSIFGP